MEIFGNGFQISGLIHIGQFGRLSDRLNARPGFIAVRHALLTALGQTISPGFDQPKATLWVQLSQIVVVAERLADHSPRLGTPVVQKQRRRVSIVTPGYELEGSLHVHAHGSLTQFLQSPEPHFLPMTEATVRRPSNAAVVDHFPFAMVNCEQLVSVRVLSTLSSGQVAHTEARSA